MDRLVQSHSQELKIIFTNNQKCSSTFNLTNLMHTMSVAISLTSTDPSLFSFSQPYSIIPPLSTSSFTVFLSQPCDLPPISSPLDTVLVRSSMLPTGKAHTDELRRLFSKPGPHVFRDVKIPIVFVGSEVVESLILSPDRNNSLEFAFILEKSVSACDKSDLSKLLGIAAQKGNSYFVSALIDAGADVNCRSFDGNSSPLSLAVKSGDTETVSILIESGYEINNSTDNLILHDAASLNRADLIEILCSGTEIDPNSLDSLGQTPLHIAASNGYIDVLECLLDSGGDPDIVDKKGWSPLHYASQEGHTESVELLLSNSILAKHTVTKLERKTAFELALDEEHYGIYDVLHLGDELHRAARIGDIDLMRDCLDKGAKVNSRDQNGWTPLHRAAFKGGIESVKLLLSYGGQVDIVDDIGYTPLHLAVEGGYTQVALYLIAHGAKAVLKSLKGVNVSISELDRFRDHQLSFVKNKGVVYQAQERVQNIRLLC